VSSALLDELLEREIPDDSCAFWACVLRAFPDAKTDPAQYQQALSNLGLVYGAGSETTAGSIAVTLAALAVDPDSLAKVEQVTQCCLLACSSTVLTWCIKTLAELQAEQQLLKRRSSSP
jgi:cytochrome P450